MLPKAWVSRWTEPAKVAVPKITTPFDRDFYGGPQPLKLKLRDRVKYGARWGVSLFGLSSLVTLGLSGLFSLLPWQLQVPPWLLERAGRVELLTGVGPSGIEASLLHRPAYFLTVSLPLQTALEELTYRMYFGLAFLGLVALRPAMEPRPPARGLPDIFARFIGARL